MGTSRLQLRRWIGDGLGELIIATATQDSADLNEFVSANDLNIPDNELNGREVWYASTQPASVSNKWTRRVLMTNTEDDYTITVAPDWTVAPKTGDVVELYNARGYSVTVDEIHRKIDELIMQQAAENALVEASDPVDFSSSDPVLTYPTTWTWLYGVQIKVQGETRWRTVLPGDLFLQTWDGTVEIKGQPAFRANRGQARMIGGAELSPLTNDTDTTTVDAHWLTKQAVAELRKQASLRWGDPATALTLQTTELAEAEKVRPRAIGEHPVVSFVWKLKP